MSFSKVILGSAQFMQGYGIANNPDNYSIEEMHKVLDYSSTIGIDTIDTAHAYGNTEKILGDYGVDSFKIITKIPKQEKKSKSSQVWIASKLEESLKNLKIESIHCLHLHNPKDILTSEGKKIVSQLKQLKKNGLIQNIGFSLYNSDQLEDLLSIMTPDIVQVPLNVFDRRMIENGTINNLYDQDISIHIRSIFLQGLLIMKQEDRPDYFKNWGALFKKWDMLNDHKSLNKVKNSLNFSMNIKNIQNVIIGVDDIGQLQALYQYYEARDLVLPLELSSNDENLLDPRKWQL
tara:strand:+ start:227 stop:1099 length:873 start_codon:yes stop_codon:yes gene_type:complete